VRCRTSRAQVTLSFAVQQQFATWLRRLALEPKHPRSVMPRAQSRGVSTCVDVQIVVCGRRILVFGLSPRPRTSRYRPNRSLTNCGAGIYLQTTASAQALLEPEATSIDLKKPEASCIATTDFLHPLSP